MHPPQEEPGDVAEPNERFETRSEGDHQYLPTSGSSIASSSPSPSHPTIGPTDILPPFPLTSLTLSQNEVVQVLPIPLSHLLTTEKNGPQLKPNTDNLGVKVFRGEHPYWVVKNLEQFLPEEIRYSSDAEQAEPNLTDKDQGGGGEKKRATKPRSQVYASSTRHIIGKNGDLVAVETADQVEDVSFEILASKILETNARGSSSEAGDGQKGKEKEAVAVAVFDQPLEVWGLSGWLLNVLMKRMAWWTTFPEIKKDKKDKSERGNGSGGGGDSESVKALL